MEEMGCQRTGEGGGGGGVAGFCGMENNVMSSRQKVDADATM